MDRGAILVEGAVCARHNSAGPATVSTRESEEEVFVQQTKECRLGYLKSPLWLLCGPEA